MCKAHLIPYWTCVYSELSRKDALPLPLQRLFFCLVAFSYLPITLCPLAVGHVVGLDDSYFDFDDTHASGILTLVSVTTGLSLLRLFVCFSLTAGIFTSLVWADIDAAERPLHWPKTWETDNNACYDDMFCEPSRKHRLIRRPGNTLSNFFYLFSAMVVLASAYSRAFSNEKACFILADVLFGVMMLILSISSTVWHGCNAMWSHGVDLWSMEAVIIYLPIRMMSLGAYVTICKHSLDPIVASNIASAACLLLYLVHIISNGLRWKKKNDEKFWHSHCPFAVRNRLPNSPYVKTKKDDTTNSLSLGPISLFEVYVFALMPVIHNIPSWVMAKKIYGSFGSICFGRILNVSLVIGWVYRMTERWAFDACRHIKFFGERMEMAKQNGDHLKSIAWMTLAAILSPTAVLHYCTGITLTAAFCHARSVEMVMLQKF